MNVPALIFAATITFSPFAGVIAYIITYDEYLHHLNKKQARHQALNMALFSFLIFVAAGLLSGFFFSKIFSQ